MTTVLDDLLKHAQNGDLQAQYELSLKFYNNTGEMYDPKQGYLWMKVAAESGYLKAQKALGLLYSSPQHTPYPEENAKEAFRMYQMAALQEDAQAQYWLGRCYLSGYGTPVNPEEGRRWIGAAHAKGYEEDVQESVSLDEANSSFEWEFYEEDDTEESTKQPLKPVENADETEKPKKPKSPAIQDPTDENAEVNRFDRVYLRSGFIFSGIGLGAGLVAAGLLSLLIMFLSSGSSLYGLIFLILGLVGCGAGFYYGYNVAHQQAQDLAYYRGTPFYDQYGKDYDALGRAHQNAYEIYIRLSRIFTPFGHQSRIKTKKVFGSTRGYVIPRMIIPTQNGEVEIDQLIVSEKALYFLAIRGVTGSISGSANDEEWKVTTHSGRVRYFVNPLRQNGEGILALQEAIHQYCEEDVFIHDLPVYSIAVFEEEVNIDGITDVSKDKHQFVFSCGGEKIRSFAEMYESKNTLHTEEMTQVMQAVIELLKDHKSNARKSAGNQK